MADAYKAIADIEAAVEKLQPIMEIGFRKSHILLDKIEKVKNLQIFADNKFIIPAVFNDPGNGRAVAEGTTLPTARKSSSAKMYGKLIKLVSTTQITWEALQILEGGGSIEDEAKSQVNRLMRGLRKVVNQQLHGYKVNGAIAKVKSKGTDNKTITLYYHCTASPGTDDANEPGSLWCMRGGSVVIDAAADLGTSSNVSNISKILDKETIYLETACAGIAVDDLVVPGEVDPFASGSNLTQYGIAITGLWEHLGNSGTYQGLSRSDYPEICANVFGNSGTLRDISELLLMRALESPFEVTGEANQTDLVMMHPSMERAYWKTLQGMRVFNDNAPIKGADLTGLQAGGLTLTKELMPPGYIIGLNTKSFKWAVGADFQFDKETGKIWRRRGTAGQKHIYTAEAYVYGQLFCVEPPANWIIKDLKADSQMA